LNSKTLLRVTNGVFRLSVILFTALLFVATSRAQSPAVSRLSPGAVKPGTDTALICHGANLDGARALWTTFAATATPLRSDASQAVFQIAVPDGTPAGIHALRVISTNGVSSLHLLMVDDLPSIAAQTTNHTLATAQPIPYPAAVDGTIESLKAHFFRFRAQKGQRITVEVVAQRLGSALDPVLRLLDAQGRPLAFNDDAPGMGADARLTHRFTTAGEYVLELRDATYQGSERHRYRLRLGDFPPVHAPFPMAVKAGSPAIIQFLASENETLPQQPVNVPADSRRVPLDVRYPKGQGSAFVSVRTGDVVAALESEPNDSPVQANELNLPCAVTGRFASPGDVDVFEFTAKKGERWWFNGQTRSLGTPSELFFRLLDGSGKQVAELDATRADEGSLTNTFNTDGRFRLVVEELARRGGPAHAYRIEIQRFAGFGLSVEAERLEVAPGGAVDLKVTAARRDFNGPITVSLAGGVPGLSLADNIIGEKKNETILKLKPDAGERGGRWLHVRLRGTGNVNGAEHTAEVSTLPAVRKLFPTLRQPPADLDGLVAIWIKPATK
jgi:hypothetical protein